MKSTQELTRALADCIAACHHCATACLEEENVGMMVGCIRSDLDCAAFCQTTLGFVGRSSSQLDAVLRLCIELCRACEQECRQHDHDHCQRCADACRACHRACEAHVGAAA